MKVKLSKRLKAVSDYVTNGKSLADIGTDHAYIPIYLIQNKIINKAIALDVNKGPITRAHENIMAHNMGCYIETRISDGFSALHLKEVDCAVIAGMGGNLIIKILSNHLHVAKELKEIILQPQSELPLVRQFLAQNGFEMKDENMVYDEGKFYNIIYAVPNKSLLKTNNHIKDTYGNFLIQKKHPVFQQFLLHKEKKLKKIQDQISTSLNEKQQQRVIEIEKELVEINSILLTIGRNSI